MCGHVGIAGKLESKDEKCMKRLLIQDYFRGPDSTGFAALRLDGSHKIAKISSHPIDLFQMKSFTDALQGYTSSVFLGHNRYATKGLVNTYNAHPYEFDHIVGAHNGTLDKSSWDSLHKLLETEYPVDSMAIIASIAKFGIEETVKHLQGAWALVWFDKTEGTLNFLRNSERTFWVAYSEDMKKVFWASEHPMIKASLDMADSVNPYKIFRTKDKGYGYFSTEVDALYSFRLNDLIEGKFDKEVQPDARVRLEDGSVKSYKGKEPVKVVHYGGTHGNFTQGSYTGSTSMTTTPTKTHGDSTTQSRFDSLKPTKNVIHLKGDDFNPLAGYIDRKAFDKYAQYGCSWCQADVDYGDVGITVYPDLEAVRCADCSGNYNHNKIYLPPVDFDKVGVM